MQMDHTWGAPIGLNKSPGLTGIEVTVELYVTSLEKKNNNLVV